MSATKTRKKKSPSLAALISSQQGLESAVNRYITLSLDLTKRRVKMEAKVAKLKAEYDAEVQPIGEEILSLETGIQLYCTSHRATLFPENRKSIELANATVGFRLTPYSVDKLISKDTWEAIADRLDGLEWGEKYVVTKLAPDKELLLKDRANLTPAQQTAAGIKFSQSENFFLEPDSKLLEAARKPVESEVAA